MTGIESRIAHWCQRLAAAAHLTDFSEFKAAAAQVRAALYELNIKDAPSDQREVADLVRAHEQITSRMLALATLEQAELLFGDGWDTERADTIADLAHAALGEQ